MGESSVTLVDDGIKQSLLDTKSPYGDAVYKELAAINGQINRMTRQTLLHKMKHLKLCTDGSNDVLKKRLKNYHKTKKLASISVNTSKNLHPYYVIVDFEATCEEVNPSDYPHEIIEFPAVLVNSEKQEIEDIFKSYCRPIIKPTLSKFCIELTGITQDKVDAADPFPAVLSRFESWLAKHELGTKYKYAIVTDGPWDMGRFLYNQCKLSGIPYPCFGKKWVNIRKTFSNFYKSKRYCLKLMVEHLEIGFEGRPHCGLDDARNIARVLIHLIADGASVHINERIHLSAACNTKSSSRNINSDQSERRVLSVDEYAATKDNMKWQGQIGEKHKFLNCGTNTVSKTDFSSRKDDPIADISAQLSVCEVTLSSDESSS